MNCFLIADYSTDKVHQGTDSATLSAHVRRPLPIIHLKKNKKRLFRLHSTLCSSSRHVLGKYNPRM